MTSRTSRGRLIPAAPRGARQGAALLTLGIAAVLAGCGSTGDVARTLDNQEQIRQARAEGVQTARQEEKLKELARQVREAKGTSGSPVVPPTGGGTSSTPSTGGDCGDGITAGANTTCPFARNVRDTYSRNGGGDIVVNVYSPVTGKTYAMSCHTGSTHYCVGGNNASVSFP